MNKTTAAEKKESIKKAAEDFLREVIISTGVSSLEPVDNSKGIQQYEVIAEGDLQLKVNSGLNISGVDAGLIITALAYLQIYDSRAGKLKDLVKDLVKEDFDNLWILFQGKVLVTNLLIDCVADIFKKSIPEIIGGPCPVLDGESLAINQRV